MKLRESRPFQWISTLPSPKRDVLALSVIFFIATSLFGQYYAKQADAALHIVSSRFILEHGTIPYTDTAFQLTSPYVYPPAFHVFGTLSKLLFGYYTAIVSIAGAVSILLTFRVVRHWYDESLARLAAFALAVNPFFFLASSRMYVGTTILAGFLATFVLYVTYRENGNRRWLYASLVVGGALAFVKTYGPLAAGIVTLHLLWDRRDDIVGATSTLVVPLSISIVVSLGWHVRNYLLTGTVLPRLAGGGGGSQAMPLLPSRLELWYSMTRMLGMRPSNIIIEDLGSVHATLPYLWLLLPLFLLWLLVWGVRRRSIPPFVTLWVVSISLMIVVARVVSGGRISLWPRHFITIVPIVGLYVAIGLYYVLDHVERRVPRLPKLTEAVIAVLVSVLFLQMFLSAIVLTEHERTKWEPMEEWIESNVDDDEVIYASNSRQMAYHVGDDYTVISVSTKRGHIQPDKPIEEEFRTKADWVITNDFESGGELVADAVATGTVRRCRTIDARRRLPISDIGRVWQVYWVVDDDTKTVPPACSTGG